MVGGVIIGLSRNHDGETHVNVADCPHQPKHGRGDECPRPDTCCVYTDGKREDGSEAELAIGDSFWWQSGSCYWTPRANVGATCGHREHIDCKRRCGVDYDIRLKKLGYSH